MWTTDERDAWLGPALEQMTDEQAAARALGFPGLTIRLLGVENRDMKVAGSHPREAEMTTTASAKQVSFLQGMLSRTAATDEQIKEAAAEVIDDFAKGANFQSGAADTPRFNNLDTAKMVELTVSAARNPESADKVFVSFAISALKDIRYFGGPRNR